MTNQHMIPLSRPIRDTYNAEHDMLVGPCACGGWHHDENDYLYKLGPEEIEIVEHTKKSANISSEKKA